MDERQEETHASHRLTTNALSRSDQYGEYHYNCRHSQTKDSSEVSLKWDVNIKFADRAQTVHVCVNRSLKNAKRSSYRHFVLLYTHSSASLGLNFSYCLWLKCS